MKVILLLLFIGLLLSCDSKKGVFISVSSKNTQIDSIYIVESITEKILTRLPINVKKGRWTLNHPTTGSIQTKDGKHSFLTILTHGKNLDITITTDGTIQTNSLGDSLLNYLWKSNNEFIGQNAGFIFSTDDTDSLLSLFNRFEDSRRLEIERRSAELSPQEKALLLYQNSTRIHSFLFYFGRQTKQFPPEHEFFSFINQLDNNSPWAKTLPQNLLYKHEINYLLKYDTIQSNEAFLAYVTSQTTNKDLLDFLKAIYIIEIIESPSYWEKHQRALTTETLRAIITREKSNKYYELIDKPSNSFFSSQRGEAAFDFVAEKMDGSKVNLSDFKGQVVFIDSWASWCGPCLIHRPRVLELVEKYADDPSVKILMISMDAEPADWVKYLTKKNQLNIEGDLIIEDGMNKEYGDRFNIKHIPKYMLIDQAGNILNADISEPSVAVEEMIDDELSKGKKQNSQ